MKKGILSMSQAERQRYHVLKTVINGRVTLKDGCRTMGVVGSVSAEWVTKAYPFSSYYSLKSDDFAKK